MSIRPFVLLLSLVAAFPLAAQEARDAEEATAKIRNAKDYLRDMRTSVELAKQGEYGKLTDKDRAQLDDNYDTLKDLLGDVETPLELPLDDRIAVYNAQEAIVGILERHPKDTMICRRKKSTGTRISSTECLTIAQREARTRASREAADYLAKPNPCVSGQNC